ncbi:uncharacterized protein [Diadema antillarum]|uniref:uncharacterized protein n=1 Tax=Diadema antillarum TaxID=105358 RepID=UPI003A8A0AEC
MAVGRMIGRVIEQTASVDARCHRGVCSMKTPYIRRTKMNSSAMRSGSYFETVSSHWGQCEPVVIELAKNLLNFSLNDEVLDVGCGPGVFCREVAPKVKSVTGLDAWPEMIELARKNSSASNIDFVVGDAHTFGSSFPGWAGRFDKITSLFVLQWCRNQKLVLENIIQCLKPGGALLLGVNLQSQLFSNRCSYGETCDSWLRSHPKWGPYLVGYVRERKDWEEKTDFLNMFRSVGFTVHHTDVVMTSDRNWSANNAKVQIRTLLGHLEFIPDELRESCIDDVCTWLYDVTPKNSDGELVAPLGMEESIVVVATKVNA